MSPVTVRFATSHGIALMLVLKATLLLNSCGSQNSPGNSADTNSARPDSLRADTIRSNAIPDTVFPTITYSRVHVASRAMLDSIRRRFARSKPEHEADPFRVLVTMNRKEFGYIRVGDTLILPDSIVGDLRAYSVFPMKYRGAEKLPKLIIVSNRMQAYGCYENGRLVRFAACNTGTERKPTFPGRYALNWKERLRISSLNDNWKLPYTWNFHYHAGNAFHQFTMPGRPVSHSCIRQFMTDAKWLFDWGGAARLNSDGRVIEFTGTPVIIVDIFDFRRPRYGPWIDLTSNRDGIVELPADPMAVEEALIPISQVPAGARGGLPDRQRYLEADSILRARGVIRADVRLSPSINYNALRKAKEARAAAAARKRQAPLPTTPPATQEGGEG